MRIGVAVPVLSFVLCAAAGAAAGQSDLVVPLKFTPQVSIASASTALPSSLLDRHVEIVIEEGRSQENLKAIGQGSKDDDKMFPIVSSVSVPDFVAGAVKQMVTGYGIKSATPEGLKIVIKVSRFSVNESNKALGSTYAAEVHFAYSMMNGSAMLMEGASSGAASRYGRARSAANISEVMSNAVQDAFGQMLGDQKLQEAWKTGAVVTRSTTVSASGSGSAAPATATPKETVEERLLKLNDLLKKGLITQEEYKVKRAEILKDA